MSTEPVGGSAITVGTLRSVVVTFGPSVMLDLLLGASVITTALDKLPDPRQGRAARLLRRAASAGTLLPWAYLLIVRPWHLRWGATEEETRKSLPGDDLVPRPVAEMTRALTINAPASEIWPWMAQMGAGRGGLYSYDWLENLAGLGIHSTDSIVPEYQDLKEGDVFPLDAPSGTGPTVAELVPERAIVLHFLDPQAERSVLSWAYTLHPIDEGTTRLIFRFKLDAAPRWVWGLGYPLLVEIPHFVMERKMMLGIRKRAENALGAQEGISGQEGGRLGEYRPSPVVRRVNRVVALIAAAGLTPRDTVALEVRGRRSGKRRLVALTWAEHEGERYLVALGGESEWVRNVRASGGMAAIRHGDSQEVRLEEMPMAERASILKAYLSKRALSKSPERSAREYFGLGPYPTIKELEPLANRYSVFKIVEEGHVAP